jgi:hypothetical protein
MVSRHPELSAPRSFTAGITKITESRSKNYSGVILIGRLNLEQMMGMQGWQPDRKLLKIIKELKNEGRL